MKQKYLFLQIGIRHISDFSFGELVRGKILEAVNFVRPSSILGRFLHSPAAPPEHLYQQPLLEGRQRVRLLQEFVQESGLIAVRRDVYLLDAVSSRRHRRMQHPLEVTESQLSGDPTR